MTTPSTQEEGATDLVLRARAGDQNAMAIIAQVRESAKKGNPTALKSLQLMKAYISANPVDMVEPTMFQGEADILRGDVTKNVERVVNEARKGERWAIELLSKIRKRAEAGADRAKLLTGIFKSYLATHSPFAGDVPSGIEVDVTVPQTGFLCIPCKGGENLLCVCFADGPLLRQARIDALASTFPSESEGKLFLYGVDHPEDPVMGWDMANRAKACMIMGQCVGRARGIQSARMGRAPLSVFSHEVARELEPGA
jgi:hypothetical protein